MNESTAAVQVDADAAPELLRRFGIGRLPTALLISPSGFVQGRIEGYRRADEYTAELSSLLERMPRPVTLTGSIVEFPVGGGAAERARDLSHDRTLKRSTDSEENRARSSCIILASHLEPSLALGGYCPVTLVDCKTLVIGAPELRVNYDGQSYYFAGSDEQEKFRANPARYVPVMGGLCVVSFVSAGQHVPGDPHCGAIYGGRLYLFTGPEERTRFQADPKAYAGTVAQREPATAD
jgi:YHS domain-containing protein